MVKPPLKERLIFYLLLWKFVYICGMAKKKRNEIRIVDVPDDTFKKITENAKKERRHINKQALVHIENDLKKLK